jgi:hypothetical protein
MDRYQFRFELQEHYNIAHIRNSSSESESYVNSNGC